MDYSKKMCIIIVLLVQVASEALAQMALVITCREKHFHHLIWLPFSLPSSFMVFLLQDRYSQDNVTIVIADLGYAFNYNIRISKLTTPFEFSKL